MGSCSKFRGLVSVLWEFYWELNLFEFFDCANHKDVDLFKIGFIYDGTVDAAGVISGWELFSVLFARYGRLLGGRWPLSGVYGNRWVWVLYVNFAV